MGWGGGRGGGYLVCCEGNCKLLGEGADPISITRRKPILLTPDAWLSGCWGGGFSLACEAR
jgi:hypothetical protein